MSLLQFYQQKSFIEGKHKKAFLYLSLGFGLKVLSAYPLTLFLGPIGSSLSTVLALIVVLQAFIRQEKLPQTWLKNGRFYLGLVLMLALVLGVGKILPNSSRLLLLLNVVISAGLGGGFFLVYCRVFAVFPQELWEFLPIFKEK